MSLPTTDLANVRVVESWIDRPFTGFGDTTTKVYYLRCHCSEGDYTALVLGTANLTNATTAGVIATRYADATARWVGDVDFKASDGGYITFIRRFANVPADHEDYTSSVVTLPDGNTTGSISGGTGLPVSFEYLGGDYQLTTRIEYTFDTDPTAITIVKPFFIQAERAFGDIENGSTINFTMPSLTNPTTSEFFESGNERASEATQIIKWMGDIYMGITPYITPDDIRDAPTP